MKKLSIVLAMILFLTGCSLLGSEDTDKSIEDMENDMNVIEIELSSLSDAIDLVTTEIDDFEPDELLIEIDSILSRLTQIESDLDEVTVEDIEDLYDEITYIVSGINALVLQITSLENDTTLSDRIALLEALVNDLPSGNSLRESEINYIIQNYITLTRENLGLRYYDNLNTEAYVNPCSGIFYAGKTYDYCFETTTPFRFYDSSFSTVIYDIENFKSDLSVLDELLSTISNYDESPLIVGQNFEIETYEIGVQETNDTSLLFSASDDGVTDDYLVVIAKDRIKEILFLEAIVYQTDPANNLRIRVAMDYEFNLREIQVESGTPESGGTMYYYTNYNDVQEFHNIKSDTAWNSLIQHTDYYATTRMADIDRSGERIRVAVYNDDGLIMLLDEDVSPWFMVHHTAFSNVKKIGLLINSTAYEYLQYDDDTIITNMASVEYDPTFMRPIPGQDHYLVDGILTTQAITSILFYNNTIDIDPIEANYSITFKFDKSAVTSLLNTYVNMPDYALDLDLIEIETYHVYYRGFLLKE